MSTEDPKPFGGAPLTQEEIAKLEANIPHESWPHRDAVAFDQFLNVVACKGLPDETMSSHFQRLADKGNWFGKFMSGWLDIIQKRHGQQAQAGDIARAEAVEQTEERSLGGQTPPNS